MFKRVVRFYTQFYQKRLKLVAACVTVFVVLLLCAPAFAQTTTAPTITVPTDDMIDYLNQWITVFAPIVLFLGMIPVAMRLLRYLTELFASAFGGGGR